MPAQRKWQAIDKLPLVGGCLCLDFVNTTGNRAASEPRERLNSYRDVLVFCRRTGLIAARAVPSLDRTSQRRPPQSGRVLARLRRLRETLYRILVSAIERRRPKDTDLARFNRYLRKASRLRQLRCSQGNLAWEWERGANDVRWIGPYIAQCAADLLVSPDLENLRKCGECDWLYLDTTRNGSRRWCKKACGDRVKARRYYRRKQSRA